MNDVRISALANDNSREKNAKNWQKKHNENNANGVQWN